MKLARETCTTSLFGDRRLADASLWLNILCTETESMFVTIATAVYQDLHVACNNDMGNREHVLHRYEKASLVLRLEAVL